MRLRLSFLGFFVLSTAACQPGKSDSSKRSGAEEPAGGTTPGGETAAETTMPQAQQIAIDLNPVDAQVVADLGGVLTAQLDVGEDAPQRVSASSLAVVFGSSIEIPHAAVKKAAKVTVQTGAAVASGKLAVALGIPQAQTVAPVGAAVLFEADPGFDAPSGAPFTIKLPIPSSASLTAAAPVYSVLFRVRIAAEGDRVIEGVVPSKDVTVDPAGKFLTFQARYFGAYHAFTMGQAVAAATPIPATQPLFSQKTLDDNPLVPATDLTTARVAGGPDVRGATASPIYLRWQIPSAGPVPVASQDFRLYTAAACAGAYTSQVLASSVAAQTVSGLVEGDVRSFRIVAKDATGREQDSGCSGSITLDTSAPPSLMAFSFSSVDDPATVLIHFDYPADRSDLAAVEVYRGEASAPACGSGAPALRVTDFTVDPVVDLPGKGGTTYYYRACTVDAAGNYGTPMTGSTSTKTQLLFTTLSAHGGDFGGLAGADAYCLGEATGAGRPESKWRAVLSSSAVSAKERILVLGAVKNPVSNVLFSTKSELWSGSQSFAHPFDETLVGMPAGTTAVWMGTDKFGKALAANCDDWSKTLAGFSATMGRSTATDDAVIDDATLQTCNVGSILYCISQPADAPGFVDFQLAKNEQNNAVTVSFITPAQNPTSVQAYKIFRTSGVKPPPCDDAVAAPVKTFSVSGPSYTYLDSFGMAVAGAYAYRVCGVDAAGNVIQTVGASVIMTSNL